MKKFPTKFARYYVSEDGTVWREDDEGQLYALKSHYRGGQDVPGGRYMAVNISLYDEEGKFIRQIKEYVHRLVAETLIPNPENLPEVEHKNRLKHDNAVSNLEWITKKENMDRIGKPDGTIRIIPRRGAGRNPTRYIKENGEWVLIPSERPPWNKGMKLGDPDGTITKLKSGYYKIKQDGEWVHIRRKDYDKYGLNK